MSKGRVRVRLDILPMLKEYVNAKFAQEIAEIAIQGILQSTKVGMSPVKGVGKFVGYKAVEEAGKIRKIAGRTSEANLRAKPSSTRSRGYPYSVMSRFPNKKPRPVNLRLTGTMLEDIEYIFNKAKRTVTIGIFKGKSKLKAETHNEGTQEPKVPTRQFIPIGEGQEFVDSITRGIKEVYNKRLKGIIEMSKRKP